MNVKIDIASGGSIKNLIEILAIPAFIVGLRREVIFTNFHGSNFFAFANKKPLDGMPLSDIFSSQVAKEVLAWIDTVVAGTLVHAKFSWPVSHAQGAESWSAAALMDDQENLIGFLFQRLPASLNHPQPTALPVAALTPDNTRLDALVHNELRWKTAVLSANQGVWDHDFERNRHFMSESWREMRGLAADTLVPETTEDWLLTLHPDDVEPVKRQLALQETGQTGIVNYMFRQRHSDGRWIWILSRGRVVRRDATGFPVRIIGTDTDISDIKAVEQERARLAERLGIAMQAAELGQWELDIQTNRATWDDRALQMFGINDLERDRPVSDWAGLIHPDDRQETVSYKDACLIEQQDIACDYRILTPDGTEKYIRTRGKYVADSEGGNRYIGVYIDLTPDQMKTMALEDARTQLQYESRHDALTGIANRRRLDEVYAAQMPLAGDTRMAAMHLDVDKFKHINDTLGHDAGDAALKFVAKVLQSCVPPDVLVARVGGDEFVAFFPQGHDGGDLKAIADAIVETLLEPLVYNGNKIRIGISIGIASCEVCEKSQRSLFINADMALYHAKKDVRATFRFFTQCMKEEANRRKTTQDALLLAFERGEILCHYQPQFDAETLKLSGLEALVRWNSPTLGLVMPDQFLRAAEEMGLISELDEVVLCRALVDLAAWTAEGLIVPRISVNISAQRLTDPELGARLRKMNIPSGKIVFELLESVFLEGEDKNIIANLQLFDELGIDVEIDDFGTGHASIIGLLRISPKRLKVDRELVQPIVHSNTSCALLETIIRIGRMLNIEVVAEGAETQAHVEILRHLKCDYLQGFALARPMDSASLRELLVSCRNSHSTQSSQV